MKPPQSVIEISIAESFKGKIGPVDLLAPEATLAMVVSNETLRAGGYAFRVVAPDFGLALWSHDGRLVLERNGYSVSVAPRLHHQPPLCIVIVLWTPGRLTLQCQPGGLEETVRTPLTQPPLDLLRFAQGVGILPRVSFPAYEAFRSAVHDRLSSLRESIERLGAFNAFWDQTYEGRRKAGHPTPKRETDLHPTLALLLDQWAFINGIEITRESVAGAGRLDFCLTAHIEGKGPASYCIEVKLAHAADLLHGLQVQLPDYMARKRALYGAYVVLSFRGEWFDRPTVADIHALELAIDWPQLPPSTAGASSDSRALDVPLFAAAPENIRVFLVDVSKPLPPSRA